MTLESIALIDWWARNEKSSLRSADEEPYHCNRGILTIQVAINSSPPRLRAAHAVEWWPR
jgi:hypothetical protein